MMATERRFVTMMAVLLLCAACGGQTFKDAQYDASSASFETTYVVEPEEILVSESIDADAYRQLLFVQTNLEQKQAWDSYFESALGNVDFFERVVRKDGFEQFLVQTGHAGEVQSVDGFTGLAAAQGAIGDFMVIEFDLSAGAAYQVTGEMKVYDPATARTLFHVRRQITNISGIDDPLSKPLFNAFVAWLDENSETWPEQ